jgi:hypothetical protein
MKHNEELQRLLHAFMRVKDEPFWLPIFRNHPVINVA